MEAGNLINRDKCEFTCSSNTKTIIKPVLDTPGETSDDVWACEVGTKATLRMKEKILEVEGSMLD